MSSRCSQPARDLYGLLRGQGLDFFVSVPCRLLAELIEILENDDQVLYTPVTREEEGVGLMAGAQLAGKRPAMLLQNSGVGNSVNAICSLANYYELPLVFVVSHRGTEGENIDAQRPMGAVTGPVLGDLGVECMEITSLSALGRAAGLIESGRESGRSVAMLLPFSFWRG